MLCTLLFVCVLTMAGEGVTHYGFHFASGFGEVDLGHRALQIVNINHCILLHIILSYSYTCTSTLFGIKLSGQARRTCNFMEWSIIDVSDCTSIEISIIRTQATVSKFTVIKCLWN